MADQYRLGSPDQLHLDKFMDLVDECKGDRSLREFARACCISPGTLSGIYNHKLVAPCSIRTIEAIYQNRCYGCQVTLEELMEADGYIKVNDSEAHNVMQLDRDYSLVNMRRWDTEYLEYFFEIVRERFNECEVLTKVSYPSIGRKRLMPYRVIRYADEVYDIPNETYIYGHFTRAIFTAPHSFSFSGSGGRYSKKEIDRQPIITGPETLSSTLGKILTTIACSREDELPTGFSIVVENMDRDAMQEALQSIRVTHDISVISVSPEGIDEFPLYKQGEEPSRGLLD